MNKENPFKILKEKCDAAIEAEKQSHVDLFNAIVDIIKQTRGKYLKLSWGIKYSNTYLAKDLLILNKEENCVIITRYYPTAPGTNYTEEELIKAFREQPYPVLWGGSTVNAIDDKNDQHFSGIVFNAKVDIEDMREVYNAIMYDYSNHGNGRKQVLNQD